MSELDSHPHLKPGSRRSRRLAVRRRQRRSVAVKAGATTVVILGALAAIGVGAHATFTATQSAAPSISSGTVALAAVGTSATNNRLSVGASNIAAGDTLQRAVDLKNTGTVSLASITLTTTATTSSLLDTDVTNGLQLVIDKCSVAWTESGPPYTYTCGGSTSTVLATVAVIGTNLALSNITLTSNTDNYARVTLTLPSTAGNSLQGLTSVVNFTFTATQRAGAAQ